MTHPKPFGELSRAEKGELLLAHHEGKRIEYMRIGYSPWTIARDPSWNRDLCYRIAPEPLIPDSINWDHVHSNWRFLARNKAGFPYLYQDAPHRDETRWFDGNCDFGDSANTFSSYKRGTVDWKDSLVIRPGHESSKP
jgi:hypothetical protein